MCVKSVSVSTLVCVNHPLSNLSRFLGGFVEKLTFFVQNRLRIHKKINGSFEAPKKYKSMNKIAETKLRDLVKKIGGSN